MYQGSAKLTQIYSKVNATNWTLVYRCQNCFVYDDPAHLSEALSTIHADGYDCIGAAGDDALLARVCGALPPDTTARVLPMPWGDGALFVSQDIGVGDDAPALAKRFATMSRRGSGLLGRGGALRDAPRATLRVSLSSWRRPSIASR